MIFLSWIRPTSKQQKACTDKAGSFNYDPKHRGATARSVHSLREENQLEQEGFFLNHARVLLGSGSDTYEKGKNALQSWRHFQMPWTFVDSTTRVERGAKFCVCYKELLPWVMMPLQVMYVNENKGAKKEVIKASFGFGSGTLQGHLLAGEERFSVELDENNQVWYEILSVSKPANWLSAIGYPYVKLRQKHFAKESTDALMKHISGERK